VGSQVHANLKNFSPGKYVASDTKSQAAVNRLVRKTRKELMTARIPADSPAPTSMTPKAQWLGLLSPSALAGTSRDITIRQIRIIWMSIRPSA
jgi:hypothetical protein